ALCDRLRHPGAQVEIVALAREVGVRADGDREERIARAASVAEIVPLAGEAQHVAVGDAARDRHDHTARTHRAGRSVTGRARFAPRAALAMTVGARGRQHEEALRLALAARASAARALAERR